MREGNGKPAFWGFFAHRLSLSVGLSRPLLWSLPIPHTQTVCEYVLHRGKVEGQVVFLHKTCAFFTTALVLVLQERSAECGHPRTWMWRPFPHILHRRREGRGLSCSFWSQWRVPQFFLSRTRRTVFSTLFLYAILSLSEMEISIRERVYL